MSTEEDKRKKDDDGPVHGYPIDEGKKQSGVSGFGNDARKLKEDEEELYKQGTFKEGHAGEGPKGYASGNTPGSFDPEQRKDNESSGSFKGNPDKFQQDGVEGVKTHTRPPAK